MLLADTSIWIDHFRSPDSKLQHAAESGLLSIHEFVIAELALGSLADRARILDVLWMFPINQTVSTDDLLEFIAANELMSKGIGLVDAHLLASAAASEGTFLWTRDKRLQAQAERLGLVRSI